MVEQTESKRFTPKVPVELDPPKDDPISVEELAKCDGMRVYPCTQHRFLPQFPISNAPSSKIIANVYYTTGTDPSRPTLVAIKGVVFDVSRNSAYGASGSYRVFAGKDASRALASSSLKPEDCVPEWYDLPDKEKTVLDEWYTFFSKRYNIVGKVEGAKNT
ncbi:Cytochrome b5 [Penicillium cf. viridicatum]|uniref:Cytochrome b5 n=1 Tax=Penicillium cf. viridicatum TaxID=2972119 RepID=A0A9W9N7D5_9EURO|nr:Cytochrome b5 [Penicillium cf. viridicatum]